MTAASAPTGVEAGPDEEFFLEAGGTDDDFDDLDESDSEQFESIPRPPERPRRPATIAVWSLAVAAGAALAPLASVALILVAAVISRTAHRRAAALEAVWARRGVRRSDAVVQTIGLPWHLLRAVGEIIPAALVALVVGTGFGSLSWWLVNGGYLPLATSLELGWGRGAALTMGALVLVIVLWWGPWMVGTRQGAHRCAGALAPTMGVASAWVLVAVMGLALVAFAVYLGAEPWWWPLPAGWTGTEGAIAALASQ